jgi:beta propeller repeat protein
MKAKRVVVPLLALGVLVSATTFCTLVPEPSATKTTEEGAQATQAAAGLPTDTPIPGTSSPTPSPPATIGPPEGLVEFPISTGPGSREDPAISGDVIVWGGQDEEESDFGIYGYDLSEQSGFPISTHDGSQDHPAISGNTVVWEYKESISPHIYGYDLSTGQEFPVTKEDSPQFCPAISGNTVVFRDWRKTGKCSWGGTPGFSDTSCDWDVWGADLNTGEEFPICTTTTVQGCPLISGNTVVWWVKGDMYSHQLNVSAQPTRVATGGGGYPSWSFDGNIVVWASRPEGILGHSLLTNSTFLISGGPSRTNPDISGNIVVWEDARSGEDMNIYGYDLASGEEFPICIAPGDQTDPVIDGDVVVWVDERNGNTEIYGARLPSMNSEQTERVVPAPTLTPTPAPPTFVEGKLLNAVKVRSVAWSPDGRTLASGGHEIILWDAESGERIRTLEDHAGQVSSVAFSPDGRTLASGGNEVILWEAATGERLRTLDYDQYAVSVAFSPDGATLAIGGHGDVIVLYNVKTGEHLRTLKRHTGYVTSVAFSPDGATLASASVDKTIILWDATTGEHLRTFDHIGSVYSIAWSPDGASLASGFSGSYDYAVILWDAHTGEQRSLRGAIRYSADSVAFSPDGTVLAAGSYGAVGLWDVSTGERLQTLEGHTNRVNSVAFSPNGVTLASASEEDVFVILWDVTP